MIIHCVRHYCDSTHSVDVSIDGFTITENGFEPTGRLKTNPPPPWKPHIGGGFVCSDKCAELACPDCNYDVSFEEVDVGVGVMRSPSWCHCGWTEEFGASELDLIEAVDTDLADALESPWQSS